MYLISDILYLLVYYVVRYRREVTRTNLQRSFPEKSERERRGIERRYYRHMCDLLVEGLFNMFATPPQIRRRYRIVNREVIDRYYERGQSVILLSQHYNNWEYMVVSLNFQLLHHGVGVGKPLQDKGIGSWIARRRIRYGTEVVDQTNVREVLDYYDRHHVPTAYMMLADQSPSNTRKSYWATFLHQETPFLYGPEYFARRYNYPVVYYEVRKVRRGRYEIVMSEFCPHPQETQQYDIVKKYVRQLEALLQRQPEYWLWSHRRWKRQRPADMPIDN
ncbi:MAG: lysophospholipid acyltransferase family protein [Bacteroidales bacterium]|nr:lysophospholipid acyltransferase family protein [Bacteroidales bacterium]